MQKDISFKRFFIYTNFFTFSMLVIIFSNNFLQLFIGWELVGLSSYLLIGFWHKKESAIKANLKAFAPLVFFTISCHKMFSLSMQFCQDFATSTSAPGGQRKNLCVQPRHQRWIQAVQVKFKVIGHG